MKKILIIAPYFGAFPSYFELWLFSCKYNPSINWVVYTDQNVAAYNLPSNVELSEISFHDMRMKIKDKLGLRTADYFPYKLCDFKPAYGVIFGDKIKAYDFWGYCDLDVIFGDLRNFFTEDVLNRNEKILRRGHLSLYKNCEKMNNLFRLPAPFVDQEKIFAARECMDFDEAGGHYQLLSHHKVSLYEEGIVLDILPLKRKIQTTPGSRIPNHARQIFYWANGKVYKTYQEGNLTKTKEYAYIHLQKRCMRTPSFLPTERGWYVCPDRFVDKTEPPSQPADFQRYNDSDGWKEIAHLLRFWKRALKRRWKRLVCCCHNA